MNEKRILELFENADRSDLNYFEILGTDRKENSQASFPLKYFEYRKEWDNRLYLNDAGKFPLHVDFESTNRCNLRCTMCQIDFDRIKSGDMDISLYRQVIKECHKNLLPSIKLNFRGEPTLNRNLVEMVQIAKNAGVIEVQLNTNAVSLNDRLSEDLIEAGLDRIKFSIDGATPEIYEKKRGVKYDKVVSNVKELIKIRDEKGKVRPIAHVQMVYMKDNKDDVVKYVQLWYNTANRIGFSRYRSTDRTLEDKNRVEPHPIMTVPCSQLWQRLAITFDGRILMCCGDHTALNPLGNISEVTLKEIWQSNLLNEYRYLHMKNRSNEIAACSICEINRTDPKTARIIWEKIRKNVQI